MTTPSASTPIGQSVTSSFQVEPRQHERESHEHFYKSPEWWVAILTAALVVVTWRLVSYTKKLWASTADLVRDAGDKSERELRAYVSATPYELPRFLPENHVQIKFLLVNHGKTPASDFRIACKIVVWPFPLPLGWDFGGDYSPILGTPILFPDGTRSVLFNSPDILTRETVSEILDQNARRVYIAGAVEYRDVFGANQKTTFCASVSPNLALRQVSEGMEVKSGIEFQDSNQHNDAT